MKSRRPGSIIVIAVAAILTIALLLVRSVSVEAAYPFERVRRFLSAEIGSRLAGLFRGSAAAAENVRLRREVAALSLVRGDVERTERENARLRRLLDYSARRPERWQAAPVLSSGGGAAGFRDTLRVGAGSLAGVREGAVVAVPEGLVGQVVAVTPHTAEVLLATDPELKVACTFATASGKPVRGILCGGSSERLVIRHLRDVAQVAPQTKVLTSGLGGVFPAGIEVGTLLIVTNGVRGVEGEVLPQVDYSTLEDVFIRRDR